MFTANLSVSAYVNPDREDVSRRGNPPAKSATRETSVAVPYRQAIFCIQLSAIFSLPLRRNDDRRRVAPRTMSVRSPCGERARRRRWRQGRETAREIACSRCRPGPGFPRVSLRRARPERSAHPLSAGRGARSVRAAQ